VFVAGGIQLRTVTGDPAANVARIAALGRELKAAQPELALLVVPELAVTGYSAGERFADLAEPWPDGPSLRALAALAAELDVVLIAGYAEAGGAPGPLYDAAAVFERNGRPVASYRKTHCLESELSFFANGDELPTVATSLGELGLMICWDAAFPEVARTHALAGAELLVTIGAWEDPYVADWELAVAARAYDNVVPHVAVNRAGPDGPASFSGHSRIVDCLGHPVAALDGAEDALLVGAVDFERTRTLRTGYGSQLRDRRPELYAAVSAPAAARAGAPHQARRS
jgi:predicted amidohydrolase